MRTFTFFFIRSGALVAPFEIELFETLDEAIAHAHKTLARQNYESVEIIEDGEAVFSTMAPSLIVTDCRLAEHRRHQGIHSFIRGSFLHTRRRRRSFGHPEEGHEGRAFSNDACQGRLEDLKVGPPLSANVTTRIKNRASANLKPDNWLRAYALFSDAGVEALTFTPNSYGLCSLAFADALNRRRVQGIDLGSPLPLALGPYPPGQ